MGHSVHVSDLGVVAGDEGSVTGVLVFVVVTVVVVAAPAAASAGVAIAVHGASPAFCAGAASPGTAEAAGASGLSLVAVESVEPQYFPMRMTDEYQERKQLLDEIGHQMSGMIVSWLAQMVLVCLSVQWVLVEWEVEPYHASWISLTLPCQRYPVIE